MSNYFNSFDEFEEDVQENAYYDSLLKEHDELTKLENLFDDEIDELLSDDDIYGDDEDCFSYIPFDDHHEFDDEEIY